MNKLKLSPKKADLSGPKTVDSTSPEGLEFHFADEAKPLATPWQVAIERAKLVRKCNIPKGLILDPACGSGIQLAAYCAMLGRVGLGIEMHEQTAIAANANLRRVADHGFSDCLLDSSIVVGDGTVGSPSQKFAMLHLDPARPRNSRTHGLDEMRPKLPEIFDAWKDSLIHGERGPAILLDLSPRLDSSLRKQVEEIVESFWPGIGKTWVWTSRGKGRVDRLALWVGQLSTPGISRRFVRIPPDLKLKPLIIEGDEIEIAGHRRPPRKGEYVSILDAALVESRLVMKYLESVASNQEIIWSVVDGRRPQIHHPRAMEFSDNQQKLLVQATGKVVKLVHSELSMDTISHLVQASRDYGFGKLTIRVAVEPDLQPRLQGSLDRQLSAKGGSHVGFVAKQPHDSMLLLCLE